MKPGSFEFGPSFPEVTSRIAYPPLMSYHLCSLKMIENEEKWIPDAARAVSLAILPHDARIPAAYLRENDGGFEVELIQVD